MRDTHDKAGPLESFLAAMGPVPSAFEPLYECDVDCPVRLFAGEAQLTAGGRTQTAQCEIQYSWRPLEGPEVVIEALPINPHGEATLFVPALGMQTTVLVRRARFGSAPPRLVGQLTGPVQFGQPAGLARVVFHIGNFPFVLGEQVRHGTFFSRGRMPFESHPWQVVIDRVGNSGPANAPELPSRLREVRGHAITHVGTLSRLDGNVFDATDAEPILDDVGRTLGFARAAFSTPILRVGFDATDARAWECWSGYRTDAWRIQENWFSENDPQILQSVFAGWRGLAQSTSGEVLRAALRLYVDAHVPGLAAETRLVLAQAALEGLADGWPYPALSAAPALPPYNSPAAARLASLSVSLGLSLTVPPSLVELEALTRPNATAPAMDKVVWVRNSVAHLNNVARLSDHPSGIRYEARQFATQHLELALLRMLDAQGLFVDRLDYRRPPQRLPWM